MTLSHEDLRKKWTPVVIPEQCPVCAGPMMVNPRTQEGYCLQADKAMVEAVHAEPFPQEVAEHYAQSCFAANDGEPEALALLDRVADLERHLAATPAAVIKAGIEELLGRWDVAAGAQAAEILGEVGQLLNLPARFVPTGDQLNDVFRRDSLFMIDNTWKEPSWLIDFFTESYARKSIVADFVAITGLFLAGSKHEFLTELIIFQMKAYRMGVLFEREGFLLEEPKPPLKEAEDAAASVVEH